MKKLSDTTGGVVVEEGFFAPYQLQRNKFFLIVLTSWALFYFHKIPYYTFWPNFLQRVMRYDLHWKRGMIFQELVTHAKKPFICILLKHLYIPHINNLLLMLDLFVRLMMTCLWRHYLLHDVFTQHNSFHINEILQKVFCHIR